MKRLALFVLTIALARTSLADVSVSYTPKLHLDSYTLSGADASDQSFLSTFIKSGDFVVSSFDATVGSGSSGGVEFRADYRATIGLPPDGSLWVSASITTVKTTKAGVDSYEVYVFDGNNEFVPFAHFTNLSNLDGKFTILCNTDINFAKLNATYTLSFTKSGS